MRLVIIGYGYSSSAVARALEGQAESLHVTARGAEKIERLRSDGTDALAFDGSALSPALATALSGATHLLMSAPPGEAGDPLLAAPGFSDLEVPALRRVAYLSTVGVYGDHGGAWVDETSPLRPVSQRSRQRVAAEESWQAFAAARNLDLGIFRLSGIYGPGRSAIDNLRAGTARRIIKPGQVFNRIHVEDIGGAVARALMRDGPLSIFNLTDDEPCPPQDVVTYAAGLLGMTPPPEIPFEAADLSPMGRSFYGENKRVSNAKIRCELGYRFRYPTYREGLKACLEAPA
ncbi:MAG TPA: SDR family oxidoreductase [Rhabdaerophilum sp.]|nr:SDR family oxidoreductase [Rhabdaerophilum sp.]